MRMLSSVWVAGTKFASLKRIELNNPLFFHTKLYASLFHFFISLGFGKSYYVNHFILFSNSFPFKDGLYSRISRLGTQEYVLYLIKKKKKEKINNQFYKG